MATARSRVAYSATPPPPELSRPENTAPAPFPLVPTVDEFRRLAARVNWGNLANDLVRGDLSRLTPMDAAQIKLWCAHPTVESIAIRQGIDAQRLVIATLASLLNFNWHARRVAGKLATKIQIADLVAAVSIVWSPPPRPKP